MFFLLSSVFHKTLISTTDGKFLDSHTLFPISVFTRIVSGAESGYAA